MTGKKKKSKGKEITLNLQLLFENSEHVSMTKLEFQSLIIASLDSLHGQVGAAIDFSIECFNNCSAFLKLRNESDLVKFWSALTLCNVYKNRRCMFCVDVLR